MWSDAGEERNKAGDAFFEVKWIRFIYFTSTRYFRLSTCYLSNGILDITLTTLAWHVACLLVCKGTTISANYLYIFEGIRYKVFEKFTELNTISAALICWFKLKLHLLIELINFIFLAALRYISLAHDFCFVKTAKQVNFRNEILNQYVVHMLLYLSFIRFFLLLNASRSHATNLADWIIRVGKVKI